MKGTIKPIARTMPFQFITALCISLIILIGCPQTNHAEVLNVPLVQQSDGPVDLTNFDILSIDGITPYSITQTNEYALMSFEERAALINGGNNDPQLVIELCVLAIVLIIVVIGGCAIKKLIDKLPPVTPPPPPPPTNAPPWTNTPGPGDITIMSSLPTGAASNLVLNPPVGDDNEGMQSWYIASHPYVLTNPVAYIDPFTGRPYTHIITTSVQGTPTLESPDWKVVGSRMLWLSITNGSAGNDVLIGSYFLAIYDSKGNVIGKVTDRIGFGHPPQGGGYLRNSVRVLSHEIGTNHFFRLALPQTNAIGILTEP